MTDPKETQLAQFKHHYDLVFRTLRIERGHRQAQQSAALLLTTHEYWQDSIHEIDVALESLMLMKEIGAAAIGAVGD